MKIDRKTQESNEISTSSLPDIIFMLLIFFMVTTVMREFEGLNVCGYTYAEQYRKVYFQVVTEDVFEADSMFFSQTTYKPLVQLTPIVMFGSPYMMKNLYL